MMELDNTRPAFRILAVAGFYGPDDHLYQEGEEIYYEGEPNEEMEPLNQLARERMVVYLEKLDALAKEAAVKKGIPFNGRPRTLDGAVAFAREIERAQVPVMGHVGPRKEAGIEKVEKEAIPETGGINPKRGRGRPAKAKSLSVAA